MRSSEECVFAKICKIRSFSPSLLISAILKYGPVGSSSGTMYLFNIFIYSFFTALLSPFAYTGIVDIPDISKAVDKIAAKIFVFIVFNIIFSPLFFQLIVPVTYLKI